MPDILIPLYALPPLLEPIEGIEIRRPMAHEKSAITEWIAANFHSGWIGEFETSFKSHPVTSFIAVRERRIVGFASYDVTCRAFFGPTGVITSERGRGVGRLLLIYSMYGLRELGYAYGIIGAAGPVEFYEKTLGGIVIAGSSPGIYPRQSLLNE